jgi:hypothetical protein
MKRGPTPHAPDARNPSDFSLLVYTDRCTDLPEPVRARVMHTVRRHINVSSIPSGRLRLSRRMLVGVDAHRSQELQPHAGRSQEHGVDAHPGRRSGRSVPAANA